MLFAVAAAKGKSLGEIARGRHAVNAEGKNHNRDHPQHGVRRAGFFLRVKDTFAHTQNLVPRKADVQTHEHQREISRSRMQPFQIELGRDDLRKDDFGNQDPCHRHHAEVGDQQPHEDIFQFCFCRHGAEFFADARDPLAVEYDMRYQSCREAEPGDLVEGHAAECGLVEQDHKHQQHENVKHQHSDFSFFRHTLIPPLTFSTVPCFFGTMEIISGIT